MVAVMGPSGSGKSTLLTIAGSLEDPTNGEVLVGGAALSGMSRNQRARLRRRSIGYVFQDFNLLAGLTAAENVALPLELDGATAKAARVAGMAALDELGLADRSARFPDELSGGERQRVAIARRAPVVVRLALRDLARYRARSGAALAAVSFAVLIAMVISLLATGRYADPVDYFGPNLPSNQLVVYAPGTGPGSGGPDPGVPNAQRSPAELQAVASTIAASLGSHDVLALDSTGATLAKVTRQGWLEGPGVVYAATPALLRHYGINPSAIDPTTLLITSRPGLEGTPDLQLRSPEGPGVAGCAPGRCVANPKIQTFNGLPTDTSGPNLFVTSHAVDTLKLQVSPAGWLIQTSQPLSAAQINAARQAATAAGMTIETRSQAPSLAQLRDYATAAGILLALAVLAMTVGLIRSETVGDLRTLTANGANSTTRRSITAATAGALGAARHRRRLSRHDRAVPKPARRTDEPGASHGPHTRRHRPARRRDDRQLAPRRARTAHHRPSANRISVDLTNERADAGTTCPAASRQGGEPCSPPASTVHTLGQVPSRCQRRSGHSRSAMARTAGGYRAMTRRRPSLPTRGRGWPTSAPGSWSPMPVGCRLPPTAPSRWSPGRGRLWAGVQPLPSVEAHQRAGQQHEPEPPR